MGIVIGEVLEEWTNDGEEPSDLLAYVSVSATLDGVPIRFGTLVGVPESQHGTCRAARSGVEPFLQTWWADSTDWQDVPSDRRQEAEEALADVAERLWREALALRGE